MKTLKLSVLAIASIAAMVSCSSENDIINEVDPNGEKVEIKLNAGVVGVETKAPVTSGSTFTPSIVGWTAETVPTTTTAPGWITTPTAAISGNAKDAEIILSTKQYYDVDINKHSYIRGYYPIGTPTAGAVAFDNTQGDVDVMMTEIVDAGTKSATEAATLTFSHKLSQLNIEIKKDASLPASVTLTSITIKNAEIPTGFDVVTGAITYATPADLAIAGITGQSIDSGGKAGNPVMLKPFAATTDALTLDVVTSQGTFADIPVTLATADTDGGTSYTVTLTFKQKEIQTKATVTDWTSSTGSGDVM